MGIPSNLQVDVQRLFDAHNANPANGEVDSLLGGYTDGMTSDGSQFIALFLFGIQQHSLSFVQLADMHNRLVQPLGNCPMAVYGFASNTTNANWSHAQNNELALDRMRELGFALVNDGVSEDLVVGKANDSGELGDAGVEDPDERFSMVVVTLNGATPPPPLANA
jgi:hypothetical protein